MTPLQAPAVCLVTDRRRLPGVFADEGDRVRALADWLDEAVDAVDLIQIRESDLDGGLLYALTSLVMCRARGSRTSVVVNTRADVARAADADGVHLRADGLPAERVRGYTPTRWLIGRSAHSLNEVSHAGDVDYVIFGTMFRTVSKPGVAPQDLTTLRDVVAAAGRPVLAIGGMTPARAAECRAAGAAGIAAIGAFLPPGAGPDAMGIRDAADAFRRAMLVV